MSEHDSTALHTEKLFSPIFLKLINPDNAYGQYDWDHDHDDDSALPHEEATEYAADHVETFRKALEEEKRHIDKDRGLMEYYHSENTAVSEAVDTKVHSLFVDVEVHDGKLWGVATLKLTEPLTKDELVDLKDYLTGQYSDGFGEGFEQREIKMGDYELSLHLWVPGDEFFIDTAQEFAHRRGVREKTSDEHGRVFPIKQITIDQLKQMTGTEGLIIEVDTDDGDLDKMASIVNKLFTREGVLRNGDTLKDVYTFEYDGRAHLLFNMQGIDFDRERLHQLDLKLNDFSQNRFGIEPEVPVQETPPESTPKYSLKACISNPDRPHDGGFSLPLPTTEEVFAPFLENLRIKDIHNIKVDDVYSTHEDDNNLSFWLDRALCVPDSRHSLVSLNHLVTKISGMNEEERNTFAAALQAGWDCDTVEDMIRLADNLGNYYLETAAINAKMYGDFINAIDQENTCIAFERLQKSSDYEENELAKYIERLEKCVDLAAYGKLTAEREGGVFTDYGYLRRLWAERERPHEAQAVATEESKAVPERPAVKVKVKPSLKEVLRLGKQKSREQFGAPTQEQNKDKGDPTL